MPRLEAGVGKVGYSRALEEKAGKRPKKGARNDSTAPGRGKLFPLGDKVGEGEGVPRCLHLNARAGSSRFSASMCRHAYSGGELAMARWVRIPKTMRDP